MKQFLLIVIFSVNSFCLGMFSIHRINYAQNTDKKPRVSSTPCPSKEDIEEELLGLIDDKYITKENGEKLKIDSSSFNLHYSLKESKVIPLKDKGFLISFGRKIYRFDEQFQVVWSYSVTQWIIDYTIVEATNKIYGTAGDNEVFVLDANDGKQLFKDARQGKASYGIVENYSKNKALIMDDFVMYREGNRYVGETPAKDGIGIWQNNKEIWHADFPPDAELVTNGERVLAVTKTDKGIYVKEITIPSKFKD